MSRAREVSKIVLTVDSVENSISNIDLSSSINTASAAAVAYLIDGAPAALNTLNELAAALNDNESFATTVTNELSSKLSISSASATYLTNLSASSSYLSQSSASNVYVRRNNANYAVSNATATTHGNTSPTTIASVTLTTNGNPVLLAGTGDMNPTGGPTWFWFRLYRGETPLGKLVLCESTGNSINVPYSNVHIDTPSAGTYTYSLRSWRGGANSASFGETGNDQAPTVLAVELF